MTTVDALIAWLDRLPSVDGKTVVGWRFEVAEGAGVRSGVRDSRLGGPYEGPGLAIRLGGSVELHWSDGLVTRAGLDRRAATDPARELAGWRADAVRERNGRLPTLSGPTALPEVETFDPALADAVAGGASTLQRMLQQLLGDCRSAGIGRIDAVMRASRSVRSVVTSRGFRADWDETSSSIDLWADEIASATYGRRSLPGGADIDRLVGEVAALSTRLEVPQELPSTTRGVLFMPPVVQDLLGRLLLPNLSGRAIRDGRSPFTRADLESARRILRGDFNIVVDTTMPLALATAPCSPEGVPAGSVRLISGGRLVSPILDLTTAADFGLPPTPLPRGRPTVLLTSEQPEIEHREALELLGNGVIVRDLPGLHTQQARRGSYALVVPDAQVVIDGAAGGRCAVRLAGNLLSQLTQPTTRVVRIPGDLGIGLLVLSDVELLPA